MSRRRTEEDIRASEYVTIGELVRITGVRYSTLKYYTEIGLIEFEQEDAGLTRRYRQESTVLRIKQILHEKEKGKTIEEIIKSGMKTGEG